MPNVASRPEAGRRVLIVEDERAVCDLLRDIVAEAGLAAACVHSDEDAYEILGTGADFVCMIVDVNLGSGTTGYDVARYGRSLRPRMPVIYVSGQTSEDSYRANGVPGGLLVFKPFTSPELLERLRKLVGDNDD